MKVLVLGSGGREHALVRALKASPAVKELHVAPGNDGMRGDAQVHAISLTEVDALLKLYKQNNFDLVVVGPDQALADGIADQFRAVGATVFGPSQEAARLEWSKSYAKEFMSAAGIPTARFQVLKSVADVEHAMEDFSPPWVLKADGLALGKGVYICSTAEELGRAAAEIFVEKKFGASGEVAIIEEFKPGWEISVHVLTNGEDYQIFPFAQDHKRLLEDNKGPNTGGMGTVAPIPVSAALVEKIKTRVVQPAIAEIKKRGLLFRGVLFIGLMVCEGDEGTEEPITLEFNARFGDPEAQVFMPLLESDWAETLLAFAQGKCPKLEWNSKSAVCVVLAAPGYPDAPRKGVLISGIEAVATSDTQYVLHAGTRQTPSGFVTNGGRVLNAIGVGSSFEEARKNAYELASEIRWDGQVLRKDIGKQFTS